MGSAAFAAWRKERENTVVRHLAGPYQPLPPSPPPDRAAPNDLDAHQGARASAMTLWPQPNDFEHSQPSLSSSESPMWEEVVQCGRLCPYAYDGECDDGGSVCHLPALTFVGSPG